MNEYTINAEGKRLGRIASEAAILLMGKNRTDFVRNKIPNVKVNIINSSKADVRSRKIDSKTYKSYSGYPGGLKIQSMKKVIIDKGFRETFRKAVHGMLPSNKLRPEMMKNLNVVE